MFILIFPAEGYWSESRILSIWVFFPYKLLPYQTLSKCWFHRIGFVKQIQHNHLQPGTIVGLFSMALIGFLTTESISKENSIKATVFFVTFSIIKNYWWAKQYKWWNSNAIDQPASLEEHWLQKSIIKIYPVEKLAWGPDWLQWGNKELPF